MSFSYSSVLHKSGIAFLRLVVLLAATFHPLKASAQQHVDGYWNDIFGEELQGAQGMSESVEALALHPITGDIYAGGTFRDAGQVDALRIARWDGAGWSPLGEGTNNYIWAVEIDAAGNVYVGGGFTEAGGQEANYIAMWDGANWSPLGQGLEARVRSIKVDPATGNVFVGGDFDYAVNGDGSQVDSPFIVMWNGGSWEAVGQGANGGAGQNVDAIEIDPLDGSLFVGGNIGPGMRNADGSLVPATDLARWDGNAWEGVEPDFTLSVTALAFDPQGNLYAGHRGNGHFARWDRNEWVVPAGGTSGVIHDLLVKDGRVYATGQFESAYQENGQELRVNNVAKYDPTANAWSILGSGLIDRANFNSLALLDNGESIFVGGRFEEAGSVPSRNIAEWFTTPPSVPMVYTTFQLDLRRIRESTLMSAGGIGLVHVFTGSNANRFTLTESNVDGIWTAIVPQPVGETIEYSFAFEYDRDGYDEGDRVYELEGPNGAREVFLTGNQPVVLPTVSFDDVAYAPFDPQYMFRVRRDFEAGNPFEQTLGNPNDGRTWIDVDQLDRSMAIVVYWYVDDPGGAAPTGIAQVSSGTYWNMVQHPLMAQFTSSVRFNIAPIAGIGAPEDLRILHRSSPTAPWADLDTDVDAVEMTVSTANVSSFNGQWTLGSVSSANPLTPDPPGVAANPYPADGTLNGPVLPELRWQPGASSQTFDVFVWPAGAQEPLAPTGDNLSSASFQVPSNLTFGDEYNWRVVAHNVNGPTQGPVWTFTVGTVPDLEVSTVSTAGDAFSGQEIEVTWTVTNIGDGGTNVPKWTDAVMVTDSPVFDAEDALFLAAPRNLTSLGPGESYTNTVTAALPKGLSGTQYVHVVADAVIGDIVEPLYRIHDTVLPGEDRMSEIHEDNNIGVSDALAVTLSPYADLEVTTVVAPDNVFSGDEITVTWTVENVGTAATEVGTWFDSVFLSEDDEFETIFTFHDDQTVFDTRESLYGSSEHTGILHPGESYQANATFTLPDAALGEWFVFVATDLRGSGRQPRMGDVYEYTQEFDNFTSDAINIILTPPADLVVTAVEPPAGISSGDTIDLVWTVENQGAGPMPERRWRDRVYMSNSPVFNAGAAIALGTFAQSGTLANDESYTGSGLVTVPDGFSGDAYFHVVADVTDQVFEHDFEGNNSGANGVPAPITLSPYPDLQVESVSLVRSAATAGEQLALTYRLRNTGNASASEWADGIFISSNPVWNPDEAVEILLPADQKDVPPGGDVTSRLPITLPPDVSGTLYVYVVADAGNVLFEYPDDALNSGRSEAIAVAPYPPVDLAIRLNNVPNSVDSGALLNAPFEVVNEGEGSTLANEWSDAFFLSLDASFEPAVDIQVSTRLRSGRLAGLNQYAAEQALQIPHGLEGNYYLLAVTDVEGLSGDINAVNNVFSQPILVTLPEPSDLQVSGIAVEQELVAGSPLEISWTVQNAAVGETEKNIWKDRLLLSSDDRIGQGDLVLGEVVHEGVLGPGASYEGSLSLDVPGFASGAYYVVIQTDSQDDVYEHLAEGNNVSQERIDVLLPPPTDLTVSDIAVPAFAVPGEEISISWLVNNAGEAPAKGSIREGVFLSIDQEWDVEDPLVGVVERTLDLEPGASGKHTVYVDPEKTYSITAEGELTGTLPGVVPGLYYVIIRTDLGNAIRETDIQNNAAVSSGQVETDIETLALGGSVTFSLGPDEGRYFRVNVPSAGEDILITLSDTSPEDGSVSLFARYGEIATRGRYDEAARTPFQSSQDLTVVRSKAGEYYLLVQAESLPGIANFELSTSVLGFEITEAQPASGGNTGVVTVRVFGSKFEDGGQLLLRDANGETLPAFETYVIADNGVLARFKLRGQSPGKRDLVFRNPGGAEATLEDGFEVVPGKGPHLYVKTKYPARRPSFSPVQIEVTIGNDGTDNAIDFFMLIGARYGGISSSQAGKQPVTWPTSDSFNMTDNFRWSYQAPDPFPWMRNDVTNDRGDIFTPFWFYEIPPGEERSFTVMVNHELREGAIRHVALLALSPGSDFTESGALEDIETSYGYQTIRDPWIEAFNEGSGGYVVSSGKRQDADVAEKSLRDMVATHARGGMDVDPTTFSISNKVKFGGVGMVLGAVVMAAYLVGAGTCTVATLGACGGVAIAGAAFAVGGLGALLGTGLDNRATKDQAVQHGVDALDASGLRTLGCDNANKAGGLVQEDRACAGSVEDTDGKTRIVASHDPNDLIGPGSFGPDNWVNGRRSLQYRIRFENDSTKATAPAQLVRIEHPLDPDVDVRSFRLGNFGFGPYTFSPPENAAYHRERLSLSDSLDFDLDVTAGIDVGARQAFWILQTIDPLTGAQPANDPDLGFLAINDALGSGEGFVDYSVAAVPGVHTGDVIDAEASIYFDINAPIDTPPVFNTVDVDTPTSHVQALPFRNSNTEFDISWTTQDVGSGVARVNLYVSTDGGPFERYSEPTDAGSVLFVGEENHTYEFYTLAVDNVGHVEVQKSAGEAVTMVSTDDEPGGEVPATFALHQNYPNPFNPVTSIPFDVASRGNVNVRVFDMLGRLVRTVVSEEMTPGRYVRQLDMSSFASGIYFYEIRINGSAGVRFRDVKKFVLVK